MAPKRRRHGIDWRLVAAVTLAAVGLGWLIVALPLLDGTPNWAQDFIAYQSAGQRLVESGTLYSQLSLRGPFEPLAQNLYLYPPHLGIAMAPMAGMSAQDGATAWYLVHVALLSLACGLMPVRLRTRLLVLGMGALSYGVIRDLTMGNVSVLLLLPLVVGWRWLDRPVGSVALAMAASVRVFFSVYLLWFAVRRAWRPLLWMAGGGLALWLLSLPFVGLEGYRDYVTMLGHISGMSDLVQNRHLTFTLIRLGIPVEHAWLALVPIVALALCTVVMSRRRDPPLGYMVTAAAGILLAPFMWDHYLSVLLLPAAFLTDRGRPWAVAVPLLMWLPHELQPFVAIAALFLPFLARDAAATDADVPSATPASVPEQAPAHG